MKFIAGLIVGSAVGSAVTVSVAMLNDRIYNALLDIAADKLGTLYVRVGHDGPERRDPLHTTYNRRNGYAYYGRESKMAEDLSVRLEERFAETRAAWTDGVASFDIRFPTINAFVREFGLDALMSEEG